MNNNLIQDILDKLSLFEDPLFTFSHKDHKYHYDTEELSSVTKYISQFHKKFDEDFWSSRKSSQTGVDKEDILKQWKDTAKVSTDLGTEVHKWIENYFQNIPQYLPEDPEAILRINKFNILWGKFLKNLTPISFEVKVFSKRMKLAGTIDSIFLYQGHPIIIDWKTNKKFSTGQNGEKCWENLLPPFNEYCKNHLNEYSIQISLYMSILKEVGINIHSGYLIHIGPGDDPAKSHKVKNFLPLIESIFPL